MEKMYRILGKRGRVTIPYELRAEVGFERNDVLSFTKTEDGGAVLVRRERICDCEKSGKRELKEGMTLYDFLNNLTEEEQRAALIHLSVKWAEMEGKRHERV